MVHAFYVYLSCFMTQLQKGASPPPWPSVRSNIGSRQSEWHFWHAGSPVCTTAGRGQLLCRKRPPEGAMTMEWGACGRDPSRRCGWPSWAPSSLVVEPASGGAARATSRQSALTPIASIAAKARGMPLALCIEAYPLPVGPVCCAVDEKPPLPISVMETKEGQYCRLGLGLCVWAIKSPEYLCNTWAREWCCVMAISLPMNEKAFVKEPNCTICCGCNVLPVSGRRRRLLCSTRSDRGAPPCELASPSPPTLVVTHSGIATISAPRSEGWVRGCNAPQRSAVPGWAHLVFHF